MRSLILLISLLCLSFSLQSSVKNTFAQQEDRSGASTRVRITAQKEKPREEYIKICGQACSYETSGEVMTAFQLYFENKASTRTVQQEEYRENVQKCINGNKTCDKKMLLDSSLHYNFGKRVREMILENNSNRKNIVSLREDGDEEELNEESGRDPRGYDWLLQNGQNSWLGDYAADIDDRERDNYQFDLDDVRDAEKKLAEKREIFGEEFYQEYKNFLEIYTKPNAEAHSRLYVEEENEKAVVGRKIAAASDVKETQVFEVGKDNKRIINQDRFAKVKGQHDKLQGQLDAAVEEELAKMEDKLKKTAAKQEVEINPVSFFENDKEYLESRKRTIDRLLAKKDAASKITEEDQKTIKRAFPAVVERLSKKGLELSNSAAVLDELRTEKDRLDKVESSAEKFAEDVNFQVDKIVEDGKAEDPDTQITYVLDQNKFDDFLDKIWPTDALPSENK